MKISLLASTIGIAFASVAHADDRLFRERVAPVFERHCVRCHQGAEAKGKLDLSRRDGLRAGGESGPILTSGKPDDSRLIEFVTGDKPEMPKNADPLPANDVAALRQWIADGAAWPEGLVLRDRKPDWWSFQPLVRPAVPALNDDDVARARTPIDAFILAKLREKGLAPSPAADRRTLIRRLMFDLHGLPPAPDEIDEFVNDAQPDAYERLVDRLLDSPHYGERWARHWLDVAHYGETHGYDKDKRRPDSWPYRDYVIRSFNDDQPYDRFVSAQLAGDVLEPDVADGIIATGFIAAGPWDFVGQVELREGTVDKQITRVLDRDDMVTNAMSAFTSLTVHCARCHDHKFDPITQADYYSLQAVFAGVERASRTIDADPATARRRRALESQRRTLEAKQRDLEQQIKSVTTAGAKPSSDADALRQQLDETKAANAELQKQLAALPPAQTVYAAAASFTPQGTFTPAPNGKPRPIHLLVRGSVKSPGELMSPGTVACLPGLPSRFALKNSGDEGQRRAALAAWITDDRNPLVWRSIVNRVWHYHFGRGLVNTPNDFGRIGTRPTHPELLDWLAADFRDGDRSLKRLHRLIVTSSVYRQQSKSNDAAARLDADNRFLWRMNRQRLEAESIRDAVLAVSGRLRTSMSGPGYDLFGFKDDHSPHYDYEGHDVDDPRSQRRTVYRFIVRSVPDPFMECLDCADPSQIVPARNTTITALQALALLNNRLIVRQSEHFASRLQLFSTDTRRQVVEAYRLALGRDPADDELSRLVDFANKNGTASLCRLIFNMNEFVFVD